MGINLVSLLFLYISLLGAAPTPWTCVPGQSAPMRTNLNGDIECMSLNHHDCLWSGTCQSKLTTSASTIQPLACGAQHKTEWGSIGYDDPNHWCFKVSDFFRPWTCVPGITTPVRLNIEGDMECMSLNHRDCMWGGGDCSSKLNTDPTTIQPLICGAQHKIEWGITGYDTPNHWCWTTYEYLAPWNCILDISTPVRKNKNGDIECMSYNHHDCLWNGACKDKLSTNPSGIQPLICGNQHKVEWGSTGYDTPNHWCIRSSDYYQPWGCVPGYSAPIRINKQGDVECMSLNHHDCVWGGNCTARLTTDPSTIQPLICGAQHKAEWGMDGYGDSTHWCFLGGEYLLPWGCNGGYSTPTRLNKQGDIECMSYNHRDCLWSGNCADKLSTSPSSIQPLICGAGHLREWGITGYDTPGNWCRNLADSIVPWSCVSGVDVPLRYSGGVIQCMSFNGVDCWWVGSCAPKLSTTTGFVPVNCISSQYLDPNHWCYKGLAALKP